MTILILSLGGGGGNILRSVKALFRRDLAAVQKTDSRYAERLRRSVLTRFLDTNEFSTSDVPADERVIIGARTTRRLGSRHDPDVARAALEESTAEVEALLAPYPVVIVIGTGGKGTGAGTIFPIAQMARQQGKLVIPIFVRPSFEWHEVEKRRYDHALAISEQFDQAGIRLIEILNDRGYSSAHPQPQTRVWERMNRPIARGLRGLLYVLSDLSQVDPSDLSMLFAGPGRLRIGFAEIDPPDGGEPTEEQVHKAVKGCWSNPYSLFSKPVGTSLVCIQGQWSNVVDGRLKGGLAGLATATGSTATYNPLHAFAPDAPKPWGLTGLFAEYTGNHSPLEIAWPGVLAIRRLSAVTSAARPAPVAVGIGLDDVDVLRTPVVTEEDQPLSAAVQEGPVRSMRAARDTSKEERPFPTLWELALALNRGEPAARALAAGGATSDIPIEAAEIRKLVGTVWFRSVFQYLSPQWRDSLLNVLLDDITIHNHRVGGGRRGVPLSRLPYEELKRAASDVRTSEVVRADVHLLVSIGQLWGRETLNRVKFEPEEQAASASPLDLLLQTFRH
jgi:cell division GTPase FtsZ